MGKMGERLNTGCIRVLQLCYIHFLWVIFTLLGLVIFGIGPATLAMFTVIRQWIRGNSDIPIFNTFVNAYRMNFFESSLIGIVYLVAGWIIYIDLLYVQSLYLRALLILVGFGYLISITYMIPIMAHYEWKGTIQKFKYSVLLGISYLQYTLLLFVSLTIVYVVLFFLPGVLTFFGISIGAYMIMWATHQVFSSIEMKDEMVGNEQVHF